MLQRSIYNFGQILSDRIEFILSGFPAKGQRETTYFVRIGPLRNQRPFFLGYAEQLGGVSPLQILKVLPPRRRSSLLFVPFWLFIAPKQILCRLFRFCTAVATSNVSFAIACSGVRQVN